MCLGALLVHRDDLLPVLLGPVLLEVEEPLDGACCTWLLQLRNKLENPKPETNLTQS